MFLNNWLSNYKNNPFFKKNFFFVSHQVSIFSFVCWSKSSEHMAVLQDYSYSSPKKMEVWKCHGKGLFADSKDVLAKHSVPQEGRWFHAQALLSKHSGVLTSSVEQWTEHFKELLIPLVTPSLQEAVPEISGVLKYISVAKVTGVKCQPSSLHSSRVG